MMPILGKYIRRLKSGRLEFRRAFPKRLKPLFRRHELIVTLEARCLSEPGAMERYRAANENYELLLRTASKAAASNFDEIDRPRIAWLVERYTADCLARDDIARVAGRADPDEHDAADAGLRDILESDAPAIIETFRDDADALAASQGWVFDNTSDQFGVLCIELARAAVMANELRMERDRGNPVPTPIAPEPPKVANKRQVKPNSFAALVREEMARPTFSGGASTKQSWETSLRYLVEFMGDVAPEEIARRRVTDFADALALAPLKRAVPRNERNWPLPRLIERYAGTDIERLSYKARVTIIGALQAAWNKCQRSGTINDELPNPFARPNLGKAPPPRKNDGLTPEEARSIFSLPVFTRGERPSRGRGEASFWLPTLLLATGARPEELAQTLVADVRVDALGEWSLTITADGDHPHKGRRSLKTPSAARAIPLPLVVLELGFLDYVDWLKRNGERALFPALRPKGRRGELFARYGDWWSAYLRQNGVALGGKRPAREFRPTWATIARQCGVSREAQEYLMGHAPDTSDMNARYGSREPLAREMRKLSFCGWGMDSVRRWTPPS